MVPDASPLDISKGVSQIGMSLSKFVIGLNTTVLEDFRPGFFNLNIQRIGFYTDSTSDLPQVLLSPPTLTKDEMNRKRSLLLRLLLPIIKNIFSEQTNRRKFAKKLLMQKRNYNQMQVIAYGIRVKTHRMGSAMAIWSTLCAGLADILRVLVKYFITICIFYPLFTIGRMKKFFLKRVLRMDVKELPRME